MEEEMGELCAEGLATRGDPESCVDDPVRAWRSVDRGTCRPGYRAAKNESGVPTLSKKRKATPLAALCASRRGTPRGLGTRACTEPPCARTGRARVRPSA
jgi:hypothetical protein